VRSDKMDGEGLGFRQIVMLALGAVAIMALAYYCSIHPGPKIDTFGPAWDCVHIPKGGGPICFKNPPPKPSPPN
jgi:hypothetical protein